MFYFSVGFNSSKTRFASFGIVSPTPTEPPLGETIMRLDRLPLHEYLVEVHYSMVDSGISLDITES